jgi:hypothetical protein
MGDILGRIELPDPPPAFPPPAAGGNEARLRARLLLLVLIALWAAITLPWLLGGERLILRDVLYSHSQFKYFGAEQLKLGRIPAVNPTWSMGQPFAGNPNALPFYPGNLLYLVLPFQVAFHAHYALHWLLAFLAMRGLARELGQGPPAALLSALTWGASGYVLTLLAFYNLLTVVAWAPLAALGLARGGGRGIALGGVALGMMALGGEPMTAALLGPAMLAVALSRHGARRGLLTCLGAGTLALAVAAPQIVATLRVMPFTFRAAHGLEAVEAAWQSLRPARLLELLLPLPWGWPSDYTRFGYWSKVVTLEVPFIYSIHVGVVGVVLALFAVRRRRTWAALAAAALLFAMFAGTNPELLLRVTLGVFRYPQKAAVLFTFAVALLAGWGLESALGNRRVARALQVAGAALLALAGVLWLGRTAVAEWMRAYLADGGKAPLAYTQAILWMIGFAVAGALLAATGWALGRRRPLLVVALQLVGLLQLRPILVTDSAAAYREPPPVFAHLSEPLTLLPVPHNEPSWERRLPYPLEALNPASQARVSWFQLEPAFGVPLGVSYPLAPDVEGLTSPLHVFLMRNLQLGTWPGRVRWLARLGVGWVIRFDFDDVEGLERVARFEQFGVPVVLMRVPDPAPPLRWPDKLLWTGSPIWAFVVAANGDIPPQDALVSRVVAHRPGGRVTLVERSPDRWIFDVDSEGGLAVVQTTWHPIWKARLADGTEIPTQAAELALTGVEVPAGRHRVTLEVSSQPEKLAGGVAALALAAAIGLAVRRPRQREPA